MECERMSLGYTYGVHGLHNCLNSEGRGMNLPRQAAFFSKPQQLLRTVSLHLTVFLQVYRNEHGIYSHIVCTSLLLSLRKPQTWLT